ncbi:type II toxin-antitoxin system Phd/YefM family antitoxin [Brevibacterium album]|uniref:type II toxin-antitoxin system Phd/YefM family antitoxin n=1 Tax=Brevibacterium album TaxID=417948 RepID=UPI00040AB296|nr:type II toxin-antitoxin system Phd/YefM family antitoxin [Brevibacterium album]
MKTITMTEFNQRVSAVVSEAIARGETVQVTKHGRAVLRLVPETPAGEDPVQSLIDSGLASAPRRAHSPIGARPPVPLTHDLDDLIAAVNADADV